MGTTYREPIRWATYPLPESADAEALVGQVVGPNTMGERFVIVDVEPVDLPGHPHAARAGMACATVDDVEAARRG